MRIGAVVVVVLLVVATHRAEAYFETRSGAVRAIGLGGAYSAIAEGPEGPLWNPAGLAGARRRELLVSYEDRFAGLNIRLYDGTQERFSTQYLGFAMPIPSDFGNVGIGWFRFDTALLGEDRVTVTFARRLAAGLDAGINWRAYGLRLTANEYSLLDPDLPDVSASRWAASFDLGLLYRLRRGLRIAVAAENLRAPRIGFVARDRLRRGLTFGLARRTEHFTQSVDVGWRGLVRGERTEAFLRAGIEYHPWPERLTLRAGYDLHRLTAGLTLRWIVRPGLRLELHYAALLTTDGLAEPYGSHLFGLSTAF